MERDDDILDDLFHGCAFAAFVEQAQRQRGVPDVEATRRLAYRFYQEALAEKNGNRIPSRLENNAVPPVVKHAKLCE